MIALLENLDKKELIQLIQKLEKIIVYDKKENNFIFIDLNMMSMQEYDKTPENKSGVCQ